MDATTVNTALLALLGIGGSVLVLRYLSPIISTQEHHRRAQEAEIVKLRAEMDAEKERRSILQEMVTQRAGVDDLRQFMKLSMDDSQRLQRRMIEVLDDHVQKTSEQHAGQIGALQATTAVLERLATQK